MPKLLSISLLAAAGLFLASCAELTPPPTAATTRDHVQKVRTTAYSHNEGTGSRNAIGRRLSGGGLRSAASDWSRFPLGTHFKVLSNGEEYIIDDYGGALVGTDTIDLYKAPGAMRRWGVKHVEIEILRWGSEEESLRILRPRRRVGIVRRMITSLEKKEQERKEAEKKKKT